MDRPEESRIAWRRALALMTAVAGLGIATPLAAAAPASEQVPASAAVGKDSGELRDGALRATVRRLARGDRAPAGVQVTSGERVRVEALVRPGSASAVERQVAALGGRVEGSAGETLVQALVPADRLAELEASSDVQFVRPPLDANEPQRDSDDAFAPRFLDPTQALAGQELGKTNAPAWHAAGYTGAGVKIGIVDSFSNGLWQAAQAAGELPAPAGTFCRVNGAVCNVFSGTSDHGEGVAEIVNEMAPGASLYLATALSTADLQAAVDYFRANGVRVVSRSLTAEYDGPGDGTGPIANVINNAVANGMTWFNSAGNSAGHAAQRGSYWRGGWTDADADNWLEWGGGDELLEFDCRFVNGLRWSDWGASRTDYDLVIFDDLGATVEKTRGQDTQGPVGGPPPIEHVNASLSCGANDFDYAAVRRFDPGIGSVGDILEFMTNGAGVERWVNPFSATGPASDSASAGALSIGAVDPALGVAIGEYSSEGPSNDNRRKPDISAASCVSSFTVQPCFNGTSAATPVAAGAAALVLQSGAATSPSALKSYFLGSAAVDRGTAGADNIFGAGELVLPAPPSATPPPPAPPAPAAGPPVAPRDTVRPTTRALAGRGRRGRTIRLRYIASDDSGQTRETVIVGRGRSRLKTIKTAFGRSTGGRYYVSWRVPRRTRAGRLSFCVSSADRAGNTSPYSCARLTIRR